jgi:hypothetical protein
LSRWTWEATVAEVETWVAIARRRRENLLVYLALRPA